MVAGSLLIAGCGSPQQRSAYSNTGAQVQQELRHWRRLCDEMSGERGPAPLGAAPVRISESPADPAWPTRQSVPHYLLQSDPVLPQPERASPRDVILRPGDVIELKFYYTPELDVTQMIRPDGRIAVQLLGEVMAEGKTPGQLREELLNLYQPHLKEPKLTILLKSQHDRRVFVGGEVTRPGVIEMPGDMTVAEAVIQAGGFDMQEARVDNVVVLRQAGKRWQGYLLDMKPTLEGFATDPFFLHPRDIVYVPRTRIAEVNQWIEQHINKLIPRVPFYFSYPLNER